MTLTDAERRRNRARLLSWIRRSRKANQPCPATTAVPMAEHVKRHPILSTRAIAIMRARQVIWKDYPNYWFRLRDGREIHVIGVDEGAESWTVIYSMRTDGETRRLAVPPPTQADIDAATIRTRLNPPMHPVRHREAS